MLERLVSARVAAQARYVRDSAFPGKAAGDERTGGVPLRSVEDIVEPGTKFELGGE